jgi:hypothetical protein
MARKTYSHTEETFKALSGREAAIAKEMECDPSYIYGIKNHTHPDPYPRFRELFRAVVRGGGDASYWSEDLAAIAESIRHGADDKDLAGALLDDVGEFAAAIQEISRSIADGQLDENETHELILVMDKIKQDAIDATSQLVRHKARLKKPLRAA